ncbi:MAG: hypothetical protein JO187_10600 [Acidobacteria bacterium]|nr:hypothetical protein [Acidobacteriota bacterium]
MTGQEINRVSSRVVVGLSLLAFVMVLSGFVQPPQADEGAAAHMFQLSIVLLVPTLVAFFATADWSKPSRTTRPLAVPALILVVAFGALYYLEHFRCTGVSIDPFLVTHVR